MPSRLKIALIVIGFLVVVSLLSAAGRSQPTADVAAQPEEVPRQTPLEEIAGTQQPPIPEDSGLTLVTRIIDGDTIEVENGSIVRLIGVDAPETGKECLSAEAKAKLIALVENKAVRLEQDKSETDRYNRLLRYLWIDDVFINEVLVREGFARSLRYPPDIKHQARLKEAETAAKQDKWGIWNEQCSGVAGTTTASPAPAATTAPQKPATTTNNSAPAASCQSNTYNCTDFSTCAEATAVFTACTSDVHKLDQDEDGIPCEALCS